LSLASSTAMMTVTTLEERPAKFICI
jgi:hypothetical protein